MCDLLTLVWCVPLFCVRIVVLSCLSNMVVKSYSSLSCCMSRIYIKHLVAILGVGILRVVKGSTRSVKLILKM